MQFLLTFPNLFELKRFVDHPIFAKWVRRKGTVHSGRFITLRTLPVHTLMKKELIEEFPTTRVVYKERAKSGFKYTTIQKRDF